LWVVLVNLQTAKCSSHAAADYTFLSCGLQAGDRPIGKPAQHLFGLELALHSLEKVDCRRGTAKDEQLQQIMQHLLSKAGLMQQIQTFWFTCHQSCSQPSRTAKICIYTHLSLLCDFNLCNDQSSLELRLSRD